MARRQPRSLLLLLTLLAASALLFLAGTVLFDPAHDDGGDALRWPPWGGGARRGGRDRDAGDRPPPGRQLWHTTATAAEQALPAVTSGDVTLVYLAMGSLACQSPHLEWALWSLATAGEWTGPVVVLTDRADCVRMDMVEKVVNRPVRVQWHATPKLAANYSTMEVKLWKTRLFEVPAVATDYVLYVDVDAFVRRPLAGFVNAAKAALAEGLVDSAMALRPRSGDGPPSTVVALCAPERALPEDYKRFGLGMQKERCHSGLLFLHREHSASCLRQWRALLESGAYVRDQAALEEVLYNSTDCRASALDARDWMTYPNSTNKVAFQADVAANRTFLHVTRTYRMLEMRRHGITLPRQIGMPTDLYMLKRPVRTAAPSTAAQGAAARVATKAPAAKPPVVKPAPSSATSHYAAGGGAVRVQSTDPAAPTRVIRSKQRLQAEAAAAGRQAGAPPS